MHIFSNDVNLSGASNDRTAAWTADLLKKAQKEPTKVLEQYVQELRTEKDPEAINEKLAEDTRENETEFSILENRNEKNIKNNDFSYDTGNTETQLNDGDTRDSRYWDSGLSLFTREVFPVMRERLKQNEQFYKDNPELVGEGDVVSANLKSASIVEAELDLLQETRELFLSRPDISILSPEEQENLWNEHKKKIMNFLEKFVLNNPNTKVLSNSEKKVVKSQALMEMPTTDVMPTEQLFEQQVVEQQDYAPQVHQQEQRQEQDQRQEQHQQKVEQQKKEQNKGPKKHSLKFWNQQTGEWELVADADDADELEKVKEQKVKEYYHGSDFEGQSAPYEIFVNEHVKR